MLISAYVTAFGLGLILLLISLVFDHDHDFSDHDGMGAAFLNLKVVGAFLAAFGLVGTLVSYYGWRATQGAVAAVTGGLAFGAVTVALLRALSRQQASSHVTGDKLVGAVGYALMPIGDSGYGEVSVGGGDAYLARSYGGVGIAAGASVEVVAREGPHLVVRPVRPAVTVNHPTTS